MAVLQRGWEQASKIQESGAVWEGPVMGTNKGGVIVQFEDIKGEPGAVTLRVGCK